MPALLCVLEHALKHMHTFEFQATVYVAVQVWRGCNRCRAILIHGQNLWHNVV
jgi:hypothetical protein